jgi:hypothetical protein
VTRIAWPTYGSGGALPRMSQRRVTIVDNASSDHTPAAGTHARLLPPATPGCRGGWHPRRSRPACTRRFGGLGGQFQPPGQGGVGGLLGASTPTKALTQLLQKTSVRYRWVAAVEGANSTAGYQLATGQSVMAIGGFNGTDPTPTLAQFRASCASARSTTLSAQAAGPASPLAHQQ